jgi:ATP-dependent Lhr-like helicase
LIRQSPSPTYQLGPIAQSVHRYLKDRGASFLADVVRGTGHSPAEVEEALWELSAAGIVTADGFENLRVLLDRRRRNGAQKHSRHQSRRSAGRWSLIAASNSETGNAEALARQLLRRYGVVFRDLLGRESIESWRDLLVQYRKLELRGEIRGGRFVSGFVGEQFALPEAVEALRALRRVGSADNTAPEIKISACDPLNLAGILLPGPRVPAHPNNYVVFRNGVIVGSNVQNDSTVNHADLVTA